LAVNLLEQELARQEIKVKVTPRKFGKLDGYQFDKGCAIIAGPNRFSGTSRDLCWFF
jgi:hypothetical protein